MSRIRVLSGKRPIYTNIDMNILIFPIFSHICSYMISYINYIGKYIGNIHIKLNVNIRINRVFSRQNPDSGHYKFASTKLSVAGAFFPAKKQVPGNLWLILSGLVCIYYIQNHCCRVASSHIFCHGCFP